MWKKLSIMMSIISVLFTTTFHTQASEIIQFPDSNLKSAVLEILGKNSDDEVTINEAESVKFLNLSNKGITNLEGLQYFKNLNHLQLHQNEIKDLTALSTLTNLQILALSDNYIEDISPLANLTGLKSLNLNNNQIEHLKPLSNLPILYYLYVANNNVTDITEVDHLKELDVFDYSNNHIYDISSITGLTELRYGNITDETIYLPSQQIKKGDTVVITNPVKGEKGIVKEITVENGTYDEATNQIKWDNITTSQTLSYTFSEVIDYPKYNGMIEFSGTVFVDIVVELGEAPILSGVENLTIPYGEPFDRLKGVTAYDAEDGNLTEKIKVEGEVDVLIPGEYELTYSVTDSEGQTTTAYRVITVQLQATPINQTPIIKAEDCILEKGATFDLLEGVTAYDAEDGDLTSKIEVIHNTVDINQVGIYEVTYQVSDKEGATTALTIKIEVREIPQTGLSLFN